MPICKYVVDLKLIDRLTQNSSNQTSDSSEKFGYVEIKRSKDTWPNVHKPKIIINPFLHKWNVKSGFPTLLHL